MKRPVQALFRLIIIAIILITGYFFLSKNSSSLANLSPQLSKITDQVRQKFIETQPILSEEKETSSSQPKVMGDSTNSISDQAKQVLTTSIDKISEELDNLPKDQAANVIRQTCNQIASELEE